ncbi:MAG: hypothetical protein KDA27_12040 [Candidatus Eisenbacteria bacterium]|uniref:Uncharacterized protein n=1 Tax=Eiseniibacteriota bacterium TaxID=2212470 RepID=A0A956NFL7_UNCEI|nr:hypothetical protein [Candidatus Eisenbacteria bacterium]MCB9463833.1 hypothetical protein [Candidatus Eisenbacteria bacterium]
MNGRRRASWFAVFALLPFLSAAHCTASVLVPGLPLLEPMLEEGWVYDDGLRFEPRSGRWEALDVEPVVPVSGPSFWFDDWRWMVARDGLRGSAEDRAEEWFGLGELRLGSSRIRASKRVGDRLQISSFTGYRSSSQRMIRVEYEIVGGLVVRSEARERGESRIVLDREQTFR